MGQIVVVHMRQTWGLVAAAVLASLVLLAEPAQADCSGRVVRFSPLEVARGATLGVTGTGFGDACHDTGPPSEVKDHLGRPLTDIRLFVEQGAQRVLLAAGSADEDYEFSVDVAIPTELEPGPAALVVDVPIDVAVWWPDGAVVQITAEPVPPGFVHPGPAEFGPRASARAPAPGPGLGGRSSTAVDPMAGSSGADDNSSWPIALGAAVAVFVLVGATALWRRRWT